MSIIQKVLKIPGWLAKNRYLIWNRHRFMFVGKRTRLERPLRVDGIQNITIGNNVMVHEGAWLDAMPLTGDTVALVIKDGTTLGHYNHIYATQSIVIEKDVLTADKVYISDNLHNYEDVSLPIIKQPIKQCKPVVIGEGSWLGEHVCVIGASVGKHCVIGANSVVTKDIPDFCVAVGAPARVIKKYDELKHKWTTVNNEKK